MADYENMTKIGYSITEKDVIDKKILMMIQPVSNDTIRNFFNLVKKTNTKWSIDKCDDIMIIFKKLI